jgi:hypothetical protein
MSQQQFYLQQWNVESFTHPGKMYKVSLQNTGTLECSCPVNRN